MDNHINGEAPLESSRLALGKIAADLLDIALGSLDWDKSFIVQGGDSILAIDFIVKCREAGIHLEMAEVLTAESLNDLAKEIDGKKWELANDREFPLVNWRESALDDLDMGLQTLGLSLHDVEAIAPCSPVQEGFLISQAINPASYISRVSIRLSSTSAKQQSRPRAKEIARAWENTVQRHAILRTTFVESNDRPGKFDQIVLKDTAVRPRILTGSAPSTGSTAKPLTTRKFDVPHRLSVYEISAEELQLEVEISHALVDGHSAKILLHDLRASYSAAGYFSKQTPPPYAVFAVSQQDSLSSLEGSDGAGYWTSYLNDATESHLPLATSHPRLRDLEMARCSITLPEGKLRAVCGQLSITPANLFHVAWALAIRRIILSDTITFSYIVSGRSSAIKGAEAIVGPLVNTFPCCLTLRPETTLEDALHMAKRDFQNGLPFQNISLADLPISSTRSLKKLGNTLLSIERQVMDHGIFTEGTAMSIERMTSATDFDLAANLRYTEERIDLSLEYWASRVAWPVAEAQLTGFKDALTFLLQETGKSIADFPSLGNSDKQALREWNSTMPQSTERCVHELVQEQMTAQPASLAISSWDGEMTYGELDDASRQLAHYLTRNGVGPEVKVGLCMDKSKWAVVAMLAILRAGGAVVPLGVQHPAARIRDLVQDTAASIVLVNRAHKERLAALSNDLSLVAVDMFFEDGPAISSYSSAELCTSVRPEHTAWVIYTSGSTGKPKGVVLEHRALATSILAHGSELGIQPRDRLSQFAAYTFDVAIAETITSLSFGACVCVPSENDRLNRLTPFLLEAGITIATLTSTVAALVQPDELSTIRTLILTGEAVQPNVVDRWIGHTIVRNAYGPAESSIWTTANKVPSASAALNIGKPLAGGFWVVGPGDYNRLCPIGAPGELLIEGPLLARGYLND
ncbi:hypothetical protein M409DRAFT_38332, partial [Zasmidium cellare ATCC 36951]